MTGICKNDSFGYLRKNHIILETADYCYFVLGMRRLLIESIRILMISGGIEVNQFSRTCFILQLILELIPQTPRVLNYDLNLFESHCSYFFTLLVTSKHAHRNPNMHPSLCSWFNKITYCSTKLTLSSPFADGLFDEHYFMLSSLSSYYHIFL